VHAYYCDEKFDGYDDAKFRRVHVFMTCSSSLTVVVLCASPDTVRDIMIEAAKLNFDQQGEYVFFNIDLFAR
jgi:hypothetical protein